MNTTDTMYAMHMDTVNNKKVVAFSLSDKFPFTYGEKGTKIGYIDNLYKNHKGNIVMMNSPIIWRRIKNYCSLKVR
jgi:hypothetical protein